MSVSLISVVRDVQKPWKVWERAIKRCRPFVDEVLVLVDDRSADQSAEIARSLADRVEVVELGGPAAEWGIQRATDMATHPQVMWLADDELPSMRFLRALPTLTNRMSHAARLVWLTPNGALDVREWHVVVWPKSATQKSSIHTTVSGVPTTTHDLIYWHTASLAPHSERRHKCQMYDEAGAQGQGHERYLWDVKGTPVVSLWAARRMKQ